MQEAYHPPHSYSNFLLFRWGGGVPWQKKKNSQSEHVSSQIWCQKFFPLLGGGVPRWNFFFQSEHVSSQIWCQEFSPLLGGGGGGKSLDKNFFSGLNMYQAKSGVKNFSLYWDWVPPRKSETGYSPKNLRCGTPLEIWDLGPPLKIWDQGPPQKSETWDPPWTDTHLWKHNLPSYICTQAVTKSAQDSRKIHFLKLTMQQLLRLQVG